MKNEYRNQVMRAIIGFWEIYSYPPTIRDIASMVGQWRNEDKRPCSTSAINFHLQKLRDEGLIRWAGVSRSIIPINLEIRIHDIDNFHKCKYCMEWHEKKFICQKIFDLDQQREQDWYVRLCPICNTYFDYRIGCDECSGELVKSILDK